MPATPRRLALLLLALLAAPLATSSMVMPDLATDAVLVAEAQALYGSTDAGVHVAHDADFTRAFPRHELYVVREPTGLPMESHFMAFNRASGRGFDVTTQFNDLLADAAALLVAPADALRYARAYAHTANAELQLGRDVVGAGDAARLGVPVADPAVRQLVDGWEVRLSTWSEENGVVADWTLRFRVSTLARAEWRVTAVGAGDFRGTFEAIAWREGTRIDNEYLTTGHVLEALLEVDGILESLVLPWDVPQLPVRNLTERRNFDDSVWRVRYASVDGASTPVGVLDVGKALAEGGVFAYGKQVAIADCAGVPNPAPNWGFTSEEPDCVLDVFVVDPLALSCIACIMAGDDARIFVAPHVLEALRAMGFYTNVLKHDIHGVARVLMAHEHFHNLQYHVSQWRARWLGYLEAQARFQQTIATPYEEQDPSSLWYADAGKYQRTIDADLCVHTYDLAPYWGFLYANDGGIATLRTHLVEVAPLWRDPCNAGLATSITRTLAARPGAHDHHHDALVDMAVPAFTRDLRWGTPEGTHVENWALHVPPPATREPPSGEATWLVGAYGIHYVRLPTTRASTVACVADAAWSFHLFLEDDHGALAQQPVACDGAAVPVDGPAWREARFVAVRLAATNGTYALTVT